jgi:hypothetical protein
MAYVTICDPCVQGRHDECDESWGVPADNPEICGGGHCMCSHSDNKGKFEQELWDEAVRRNLL